MKRVNRRALMATLVAGAGLFAMGLLGIEARAQVPHDPPAAVIHGAGQDV